MTLGVGISSVWGFKFEAGLLMESHVHEELPVFVLYIYGFFFLKIIMCTSKLISSAPIIARVRSQLVS